MTNDLTITLDGAPIPGRTGQTVAGVLLASGRPTWRQTARAATPRGLFCGIGVCFDCLVTVNGDRDVRACQRRVADGDIVQSQS